MISRVALAGLCPGEFRSVVLQAQEQARSKKAITQNTVFLHSEQSLLHGNLYSHRDLYIQVAHAFMSDRAGTLDHNSLVC